jgi:hypothetical protein
MLGEERNPSETEYIPAGVTDGDRRTIPPPARVGIVPSSLLIVRAVLRLAYVSR